MLFYLVELPWSVGTSTLLVHFFCWMTDLVGWQQTPKQISIIESCCNIVRRNLSFNTPIRNLVCDFSVSIFRFSKKQCSNCLTLKTESHITIVVMRHMRAATYGTIMHQSKQFSGIAETRSWAILSRLGSPWVLNGWLYIKNFGIAIYERFWSKTVPWARKISFEKIECVCMVTWIHKAARFAKFKCYR